MNESFSTTSFEEGYYIASVPTLQGCMADGETLEEAVQAIKEAIRIWIEINTERGIEIPKPKKIIEV